MADTRNQPGQERQGGTQGGQGGRGSETDRDRQQGIEQGESERQAGQNPRRTGQEESGNPTRTGTESERPTEKNPGRQNAG